MAYQSKYTGLQIDDILDSVEWKQGKIEDLASIRAGAQKGATALQSYTEKYTGTVTGIKINGVVKSGSGVIDLGTITTDISGKVDKEEGKGLSTEDFTTALKTKLEGLNNYDDTELSNAVATLRGDFDEIVSGDTTTAIKTFNEVIAFLDGLTDTQDLESIIASIEQQIAGKMDKVTLATVATSGSYNDLSNKPTIPSAVTESTISGWGFTKNAGTYSKPSSGIPKTDLASAVQTSLGKADTAIQSTSFGELTDLAVVKGFESVQNGTVYALPDCDTGDEDDILLSRSSVKTVNGQSIVGSGDITILSGNSDANVSAVDTGDVIDDVTVNYATKTYVDGLVGDINSTIGDINSVLESIINGGGNVSIFPITLSYNVDGNETYAKVYAELDKISNKNPSSVPIDTGLIYIDLTTFAIGITEKSYEVSHIIFEGDNTYSLGTIESGPEMHTIMLSSNGTVWCLSQ